MTGKLPFKRLAKDVVPANYAIRLKPDLKKFVFDGYEEISVEVKSATTLIELNSVQLQISSVSYESEAQEFSSDKIQVAFTPEDEKVTFTFPEDLKVGKGLLKVTFTGILNDKMKGFYRSEYLGTDGEKRYAAVTQFEPTDARQAFPCWDEPAVKATFDITLVAPNDRVALSNMPVKSESPLAEDATHRVVQYERTPIMSTYLVAFIVGEYDYVEAKDSDGVLVRVYTPVGKKEQGEFALQVAVKTLPFYKNYFKIAYPLPKIDLIAIADFAAGAMENWGLVTYREVALLIDPKNSSSSAKQTVTLVVGHELAHQWFGNLVTMEWWTHLWLNEGFASWIEYLCVDYCFPEFDIWTQFATTDYTRALELDALRNSHPIEVPVGHPSEIDEIFDAISYSKGASVIRMLHDYIGDEDYRKGMNMYLTKHRGQNTFTEDLWSALAEASGKPVEAIMSTWTKQMGFPVIKVSQTIEGNKRQLTLTQEKFTADGSPADAGYQWLVPISVSTSSSPDTAVQRIVLDKPTATITIDNIKPEEWLKVNTGGIGFYRTFYPSEMLDSLLPGLTGLTLPPRDRLALQDDLFALAQARHTSLVDVLKVVEAYKNETNYTVWSDLSSNLSDLSLTLQYTDYHDHFRAFIRRLYAPVMSHLGWDVKDGEGPLNAMLRSIVINRMGNAGEEAVICEARKRFVAHCNGSAILPADLRQAVYSVVLRQGGEQEYNDLLKIFRTTDLQEERMRVLRVLGGSHDPALIQRTLDFSLSNEVRSQDTVFVIGGATATVEGRELTWKFVQNKWSDFCDRYKGTFLIARLIQFTTENFVTSEKAVEIENFFKVHPAPAADRVIQQSIEYIHLSEAQLRRDGAKVKAFLASYN